MTQDIIDSRNLQQDRENNLIEPPNYTQVPNVIFDYWMPRLTHVQFKIVMCFIAFPNKSLSCEFLRNKSGLSKSCISDVVPYLEATKIIMRISLDEEEIIALLKGKKGQIFYSDNIVTCEWCNGSTTQLQKHHWPIPQSMGGEDTVNICANCHFEYHSLVDRTFYILHPNFVARVQHG